MTCQTKPQTLEGCVLIAVYKVLALLPYHLLAPLLQAHGDAGSETDTNSGERSLGDFQEVVLHFATRAKTQVEAAVKREDGTELRKGRCCNWSATCCSGSARPRLRASDGYLTAPSLAERKDSVRIGKIVPCLEHPQCVRD